LVSGTSCWTANNDRRVNDAYSQNTPAGWSLSSSHGKVWLTRAQPTPETRKRAAETMRAAPAK